MPKIYTVIIFSAKMWTVKGFLCLLLYPLSLDALLMGLYQGYIFQISPCRLGVECTFLKFS